MKDGSIDMKKILLITNIPNAYRIPLFNKLSEQLLRLHMELVVVFAANTYSRRKSVIDLNECKFKYIILGSEGITPGNDEEKTYFSYKGLHKILKRENPSQIIVSGFSSATIKVYIYSLLNKTPFIIWSGAIHKKGRNDQWLRRKMRSFLVGKAAAFIAYGSRAKDYLVDFGADANKVTIGLNTVDTTFFKEETAKARKNLTEQSVHHLLFTGYLVPRKETDKLVEVVRLLAQKRTDFVLDIIGDGSSKTALENQIKEQNLSNYVVFHGFKQKNELPHYMAKSTLFLFQTGFDIWGLTLNEAMAAALPCIASVNAGAVKDLIQDGVTGFSVDYINASETVEIIDRLLNDKIKAGKIGATASVFIEEHASIKKSASGFVDAIKLCENIK